MSCQSLAVTIKWMENRTWKKNAWASCTLEMCLCESLDSWINLLFALTLKRSILFLGGRAGGSRGGYKGGVYHGGSHGGTGVVLKISNLLALTCTFGTITYFALFK